MKYINRLIVELLSFLFVSSFVYIVYNVFLFEILFKGEPFALSIYFGSISSFFMFYVKYLFSLFKVGVITGYILLFVLLQRKFFLRILLITGYIILFIFVNGKIILLSWLFHLFLMGLIVSKVLSRRF